MSTEFIIGTIIGLIGIVPVIIQFVRWAKKPKVSDLMKKLVDNSLSTQAHRKILKKMNVMLLPSGKHISPEFINNFVLEKRGKEAVFTDLCLSNDWEPTEELCVMFMNGDYPSIRKKYWDIKKTQLTKEKTMSMSVAKEEIHMEKPVDNKIVYMSELLLSKYPETCKNLIAILEKHHVNYSFIKGTKDIWCRDYMPVQTKSGKLVQFKYDPSYLKGNKDWEDSRSDVEEIRAKNDWLNKYVIEKSDINLDGGNVLICDGRAILSDRLFSENPDFDKESLIKRLSELLECEDIIIIPALKSQTEDLTGHADGMVRFVNRNTIIGNERRPNEYQYMRDGLQKAIDTFNLTYIDIPFFEEKDPKHPESAIGIYVNYLEVNDLIVLPVFNRTEDNQVLAILQKTFPNKHIETINYDDVAKKGGLLNCTTWVVK
jgi:agmatine/peptidylarginine deiminase